MSKWLDLGECFLSLGRDKPICYLPQWPLQQPASANFQRPSERKIFPLNPVAAASKSWEELYA